jgi:hypothetical protein
MNFFGFGANFISSWIRIQETNRMRIRIRNTDPQHCLKLLKIKHQKQLTNLNHQRFISCLSCIYPDYRYVLPFSIS